MHSFFFALLAIAVLAPLSNAQSNVTATCKVSATPSIDTADSEGNFYQVQLGDTLSKIARLHDTQPEKFQQINNLSNPNKIEAEQILVISSPAEAVSAQNMPTLPSFVSTQPFRTMEIASAQKEPEAQYQTQLKAEVNQLNQTQSITTPVASNACSIASRQVNNEQVPDWQSRFPKPVNLNQPRKDLAELQRQYSPQAQRTRFESRPVTPLAPSVAKPVVPKLSIPILLPSPPVSTQPAQIRNGLQRNSYIDAAPNPLQDYITAIQIPIIQEVSPVRPGFVPRNPNGQKTPDLVQPLSSAYRITLQEETEFRIVQRLCTEYKRGLTPGELDELASDLVEKNLSYLGSERRSPYHFAMQARIAKKC